jgi:type VI secretion system secreted protein VgrG
MARNVSVSIDVAGKSIKQFTSFSLTQALFDHHVFRLVCPTEAIDGRAGGLLEKSKDMMGATITIQVLPVGEGGGSLQFTGVITRVETSRNSGHAGDVVLHGFSPTIIMDSDVNCLSWKKTTLGDIAQDTVSKFPQNLLKTKAQPNYDGTIPYMVQYKETAWLFLCRLAMTYGEWFYFDGQKLLLGPPDGQGTALNFGKNLDSFDIGVQVQPPDFQLVAYDYVNNEVYKGSPQGTDSKAGLSEIGKVAYQKSRQFYSTQPKQWHNQYLTSQKELDDYANTVAAERSSNMVRFSGESDEPGVTLGGTVQVEGTNVYDQSTNAYGEFRVIGVNHYCDGQGNYSNNFTAVPSGVKMPPVTILGMPRCETQSAVVTDNNDPKGLGRIRVRFHWMGPSERTPWLRMAGGHGGDKKGFFFIPEVNEEVMVGFEGDSALKPYVIGSVYNGKAKTSFSNDTNDLKVIQTRTGNKIVMNDKDGSLILADQNDNNIKLDGAGNINISSKESIVLACGQSMIKLKKDGTIEITGKNISTKADEKAMMGSGQASYTADGQQNEADIAGTKVSVQGQSEVDIGGAKVAVSGQAEVDLSGAQVQVSGQAMVTIKGAMVMIN